MVERKCQLKLNDTPGSLMAGSIPATDGRGAWCWRNALVFTAYGQDRIGSDAYGMNHMNVAIQVVGDREKLNLIG